MIEKKRQTRISKKQKTYNECIDLGIDLPKPYKKLPKKMTLNKLIEMLNNKKDIRIQDNISNISETSYNSSDFEDNTEDESEYINENISTDK